MSLTPDKLPRLSTAPFSGAVHVTTAATLRSQPHQRRKQRKGRAQATAVLDISTNIFIDPVVNVFGVEIQHRRFYSQYDDIIEQAVIGMTFHIGIVAGVTDTAKQGYIQVGESRITRNI